MNHSNNNNNNLFLWQRTQLSKNEKNDFSVEQLKTINEIVKETDQYQRRDFRTLHCQDIGEHLRAILTARRMKGKIKRQ